MATIGFVVFRLNKTFFSLFVSKNPLCLRFSPGPIAEDAGVPLKWYSLLHKRWTVLVFIAQQSKDIIFIEPSDGKLFLFLTHTVETASWIIRIQEFNYRVDTAWFHDDVIFWFHIIASLCLAKYVDWKKCYLLEENWIFIFRPPTLTFFVVLDKNVEGLSYIFFIVHQKKNTKCVVWSLFTWTAVWLITYSGFLRVMILTKYRD